MKVIVDCVNKDRNPNPYIEWDKGFMLCNSMPGIASTRLYKVYRTEPNSRREELEVYEEPGMTLPHCLQYRTHVLRAFYLEVILGILEELGVLVASWSLTRRNLFIDIIQFEGSYFCVLKLELKGNQVVLRLHIHIA